MGSSEWDGQVQYELENWSSVKKDVAALRLVGWKVEVESGLSESTLVDRFDLDSFHLIARSQKVVFGAVRAQITENPRLAAQGNDYAQFLTSDYRVYGFMSRLVVSPLKSQAGIARELLDKIIHLQFDKGADVILGATSTKHIGSSLIRRGFRQISPTSYLPFSPNLKLTVFALERA
ncbi:hypothetical protein [Hyphomonas sp.]|uniref:hypothetical protein n=1 Tax=Hyphomonas sp. TaxID=87 RepID=UPI003F70312F